MNILLLGEVSADEVAQPAILSAVASHYRGRFSGKTFGCAFPMSNSFLRTISKRVTVFNYFMQCDLSVFIVFPRHPQPKKHIQSCVSMCMGHS